MKRIILLIGLSLLLAGGRASAAVTTSASADVLFELVDLDIGDGITPSLTFGGGVRWTVGSYVFNDETSQNDESAGQSGEGWSAAAGASIGVASSFASSQADLVLGTARIQVGSTAEINSQANAGAGWFSGFVISPRTQLNVTIQGRVAGTSAGDRYKQLNTQVSMELFGAVGEAWIYHNPSIREVRSTAPGSFGSTPSFLIERELTASFANSSSNEAVGELNIEVVAISLDGATPPAVPEPATWAVMLAGLFLIGLLGRGGRI